MNPYYYIAWLAIIGIILITGVAGVLLNNWIEVRNLAEDKHKKLIECIKLCPTSSESIIATTTCQFSEEYWDWYKTQDYDYIDLTLPIYQPAEEMPEFDLPLVDLPEPIELELVEPVKKCIDWAFKMYDDDHCTKWIYE